MYTQKAVENVQQTNGIKVYIDSTDYCEESKLDTQQLIKIIKSQQGKNEFFHTPNIRQADLIIYRACGHLQSIQDDAINDIKEILRHKKPKAKLIVWGCLPKIDPSKLTEIYQGPLVGPEEAQDYFSNYFSLPQELWSKVNANMLNSNNTPKSQEKSQAQTAKKSNPYSNISNKIGKVFYFKKKRTIENMWYIKILSGCKHSCTYCSDRLVYKKVKSVPIENVVKQFEIGLQNGYRDFFFVGRDLGSYGYDTCTNLANLLNKIIERNKKTDYRIFLQNVSPKSLIELYSDFEGVFASKKVVHLGTHIQSGSTRLLRLMGKEVSLIEWIKVVKDIRKKYPKIHLETNIMVGFPSEKEMDFAQTVNLVNSMLFDSVTVYKYSERPNLPSLKIKNRVPPTIINKRYDQIKHQIMLIQTKRQIKNNIFLTISGLKLFIYLGLTLFLSDSRKKFIMGSKTERYQNWT